jgi:hypothetical protein
MICRFFIRRIRFAINHWSETPERAFRIAARWFLPTEPGIALDYPILIRPIRFGCGGCLRTGTVRVKQTGDAHDDRRAESNLRLAQHYWSPMSNLPAYLSILWIRILRVNHPEVLGLLLENPGAAWKGHLPIILSPHRSQVPCSQDSSTCRNLSGLSGQGRVKT